MIPQSGRFKLPQTVFKNIYIRTSSDLGSGHFPRFLKSPSSKSKSDSTTIDKRREKKSTFKLIGPETDGVKKKTSPCL